jgi:hypothetical protein
MNRRFLCLILGGLLLLPSVTAAQQKQTSPPKPKPPTEADKKEPEKEKGAKIELSPLEQRSLDLARQASGEAVGLDDKRGAARIQAAAADLLWPHEQEYARQLFERAYETAAAYYREDKGDNPERGGRGGGAGRQQDIRLEIIGMVNKRDPNFGRELTNKYFEEKLRESQKQRTSGAGRNPEGGPMSRFGIDSSAGDLLETASSLLKADPKAAVDLAQRALALGVTPKATRFLVQLAERDRAAADQLFLSALEGLRASPSPNPAQLLVLGAYPFGENQVAVSDGGWTAVMGLGPRQNFQIDPQLIQRFLATAMTVMARIAELNLAQIPEADALGKTALFAARMFEPKAAQYQPNLLDEWLALTRVLSSVVDPQAGTKIDGAVKSVAREQAQRREQRVGQPLDAADRIKALLDQAEKTPNFNRRDSLYFSAASAAQEAGEMERAMEIIGRISNLDFRRKARDWISFEAAQSAIHDKRLDEAHRYALNVSATDQRAYLLFEIARAALDQKDRQRAIELLDEAAKKAAAADNTADKLRALLGITQVYASFDPTRAFEVMAEAVRAASKVPGYGPDDARLTRSLTTPDGSGSMDVQNVEGFDLNKTLARLASTDFERTLALAQELESKMLRLSAMVAIGAAAFEKSK